MPDSWTSFADIPVAESDVAWSKYLMDRAQSAYDVAKDNSSVTIREVGPVAATDLAAIIHGAGGAFLTNAADL